MEESLEQWLSLFNRAASITQDDIEFRLTDGDLTQMFSRLNYWHSKTDPSSWLVASVVHAVRIGLRGRVARSKAIQYCAELLNVTPEHIESTLDWNANYLSMHDNIDVEEVHKWLPEGDM